METYLTKRSRPLRNKENGAIPSTSQLNNNEVKTDSESDFESSGEYRDKTWKITESDYDENSGEDSSQLEMEDELIIAASGEGTSGTQSQFKTLCTVTTCPKAVEKRSVTNDTDRNIDTTGLNSTAIASSSNDTQKIDAVVVEETNEATKDYSEKEIETLYLENKLILDSRNTKKRKRQGPALKSAVWNKFHVLTLKETGKPVNNWVQCSQCTKFLKYNGRTTSNLNNHVCSGQNGKQTKINTFANSNSTTRQSLIKFTEFDKIVIREGAEKFIVNDLRPFFALEGEGLRSFLRAAIQIGKRHPNITENDIDRLIPSRRTMKRHVDKKSEYCINLIKMDLKKALDTVGGFCCTTDLYTDKHTHKSFLVVTVKLNIFENDCISQKEYVIHLDEIVCDVKDAENVRKEIISIFSKFDISEEQLNENTTWITDRGGNVRNAMHASERYSCFTHLINNIVKTMCTKVAVVKTMISEASALVRYLKKSGLSANEKLEHALQSYIETRWNTVYYLLKSILDNYNAILQILMERETKTGKKDLVIKLTCLSKTEMEDVCKFLYIFTKMTINIQGEKYETLHLVWPYVKKIEAHLKPSDDDSGFVTRMKETGRKYLMKEKNVEDFQPKMGHKIAVLLHPGMKSLNGASPNEKMHLIEHVKNLVNQISQSNITEPTDNVAETVNQSASENENFLDDFMSSTNANSTTSSGNLEELQNYMNFQLPMVQNSDSFNLTRWWYDNRKSYPNLFRIFLRTSVNSATSAASERAFSVVGIIVNPLRCSMLPTTINQLMITRNLHRTKMHRVIN